MHISSFFWSACFAACGVEALRSGSKVKLSNVQSLTLRKDARTSHRRVNAIPQLKCIGGSASGLYDVDVMRCKNSGSDYDEDSVQWTCTASLPEEFKLGSTDVICEGYEYPEDPYILKGSCGVEYRLILTDKGEAKYGKGRGGFWGGDDARNEGPKTMGEHIAAAVFWLLFIGVAFWIVFSAFSGWGQRPVGGDAPGARPGWGGGGGGGGPNDPYDDPPPPYYPSNPPKPRSNYGATDGWRPGFWSGALGGAAAGWAAGRMGNNSNQTNRWGSNTASGSGSGWNNGEGSSRSSSGDSYSSTRHESTGFGSTSRR
ncbi:DUF1183-domain-containing protein [Pyrenochaeta sp. DS3sAY3a]|nr:DUF1183-domain-containing protein [Pyrenochaeta sp. DS3sAY3a]